MSSLSSFIAPALNAARIAHTIYSSERGYKNQRERADRTLQAQLRNREAEQRLGEQTRKRELEKDKARMRAFLAARGLHARRGSGWAVLQGLTAQSEDAMQDKKTREKIRTDAIRQRHQENVIRLKNNRRQQREDWILGTLNKDSSQSSNLFPAARGRRRSLL